MVAQKFQIYGVKITGKYICESKNKSVHFYSCPQAKLSLRFLSLPPREKEFTYSSRTVFSVFFSPSERGTGEDYGVEKITKIKPRRVLVASFDKFNHLCNFWFLFCCAII